mmetsp:Transcript_8968/g.19543  ORF Transcript_8968/g.19543 Transcript_8968/m.19543 type:complete len:251 (-) Transcript_8968:734-1486(-)
MERTWSERTLALTQRMRLVEDALAAIAEQAASRILRRRACARRSFGVGRPPPRRRCVRRPVPRGARDAERAWAVWAVALGGRLGEGALTQQASPRAVVAVALVRPERHGGVKDASAKVARKARLRRVRQRSAPASHLPDRCGVLAVATLVLRRGSVGGAPLSALALRAVPRRSAARKAERGKEARAAWLLGDEFRLVGLACLAVGAEVWLRVEPPIGTDAPRRRAHSAECPAAAAERIAAAAHADARMAA